MVSVGGLGGFLQGLAQGIQYKREAQLRRDEMDMRREALANEGKRLDAHLRSLEQEEERARKNDHIKGLEADMKALEFERRKIQDEVGRWGQAMDGLSGMPWVGTNRETAVAGFRAASQKLEEIDSKYEELLRQAAEAYQGDAALSEASSEGIRSTIAPVAGAGAGTSPSGAAGGTTSSMGSPPSKGTGQQPSAAPEISAQDVGPVENQRVPSTPEELVADAKVQTQKFDSQIDSTVDALIANPFASSQDGNDWLLLPPESVAGATLEQGGGGWELVIGPVPVPDTTSETTVSSGRVGESGVSQGVTDTTRTSSKFNTEQVLEQAYNRMADQVVSRMGSIFGDDLSTQQIEAMREAVAEKLKGKIPWVTKSDKMTRERERMSEGDLFMPDLANQQAGIAKASGQKLPDQWGPLKDTTGVSMRPMIRNTQTGEVREGDPSNYPPPWVADGFKPAFEDEIDEGTLVSVMKWFQDTAEGGDRMMSRDHMARFLSRWAVPMVDSLVKSGSLVSDGTGPGNSQLYRVSDYGAVGGGAVRQFQSMIEDAQRNVGPSALRAAGEDALVAGKIRMGVPTPSADLGDFVVAMNGLEARRDPDRIRRDLGTLAGKLMEPVYRRGLTKEQIAAALTALDSAEEFMESEFKAAQTSPSATGFLRPMPPKTAIENMRVMLTRILAGTFTPGLGSPTAPGPQSPPKKEQRGGLPQDEIERRLKVLSTFPGIKGR